MSPVIASALRRASVVGGALAATLVAHAVSAGGATVLPVAPFLWLGTLALALLVGMGAPGSRSFRAWGPGRLLLTLLGGQAAVHALLHAAPWALGLGVHHHAPAPLLTPAALAAHVVIALLLTVALRHGQALLLRAIAIARALFAPERPRALPRPAAEASPRDPLGASQWRRGPRSSRGPPARPLPWAGSGRTLTAS